MPSDKRARQRAAREARQAALSRQRKRRATVRRIVTLVVIAGVVIGVVALLNSGKSNKASNKTSTTTTTSASGNTPASTTTTVSLAGDTTSANCPSSFKATLKKPSFSSTPPMIIDTSKHYTATVTTDVGAFTIALDASKAPNTVNSFVFLAENHFFDCVVFHRVIPGFMDQTGDPTGTGTGGPGYSFGNENVQTSYTSGEVAMANTGQANSDGSQFFLLVGSYTPPSGGYSLFGTVASGMSVVQKINADGDSSDNGQPPKVLHRMVSVVISVS